MLNLRHVLYNCDRTFVKIMSKISLIHIFYSPYFVLISFTGIIDFHVLMCVKLYQKFTLKVELAGNTEADPAPAHRAPPPPFEIFKGFFWENFDSITRINFIVINMQR